MPNVEELLATAGKAFEASQLQQAENLYRQITQTYPKHPEAWCRLGMTYHGLGRFTDAEVAYRRTLELAPDVPVVHNNLANTLAAQGRYNDAIAACKRSLQLNPDYAYGWNNLAAAQLQTRDFNDAVTSARKATELNPKFAAAFNNLAAALFELDRMEEAAAAYRDAIAVDRNFANAWQGLGSVQLRLGKLTEAITSARQALQLNPADVDSLNNLGTAYLWLGQLDDAATHYQSAEKINPKHVGTHQNLGLLHLLSGNLLAGWPEYEWRLHTSDGAKLPQFTAPRWDGSPLNGRKILLYAEQGLGDTIEFIRYASRVKARGGHVIVACQRPLMKLLQNCAGIDELVPIPKKGENTVPSHHCYIPLLSLPGVFKTTLDSVPNPVPYLHADEELIAYWRHQLQGSGDFKIGIVWQGNRTNHMDRARSIPLAAFQPLAQIPGVRLISLQKGDGSEQIAPLADRLQIVDFTERMDEATGPFLDTAAIMRSLDLVITADTSIGHLAGALGVPVWIALNFSSDWRWMLDRDDSPWYPTVRLFRQQRSGDWSGLFQRIAAEVSKLKTSSTPTPAAVKKATPTAPQPQAAVGSIYAETSFGELADKLTILEIKSDRMSDPAKLVNVRRELESLSVAFDSVRQSHATTLTSQTQLDELFAELKKVNEDLWQIEDDIRDCERHQDFGPKFITLARAVYHENDKRATLKKQINTLLGSRLVEEKSYKDYSAKPTTK